MKQPFSSRAKKPSAVRLPFTLGFGQVYIFPTRFGLLFLAVLLAMLAGSVNYNNNLGFLLTFLLGSMAFAALFHTYRVLYGLTFVSVGAKPVFAGADAVFDLGLDPGKVARLGLALTFKKGKTIFLDLASKTQARARLPVPAPSRGVLRPGRLTVLSQYPLGLFRAWYHLDLDVFCLVYPKPLSAEAAGVRGAGPGADDGPSDAGGADDFDGVFTYRPGDPPGRIFWKAYSRGQGLFSKKFMRPAGAALVLDLDKMPGKDMEARLSRLCGCAWRPPASAGFSD